MDAFVIVEKESTCNMAGFECEWCEVRASETASVWVWVRGVRGGAGERVVLLGRMPALVAHRYELLRVRPGNHITYYNVKRK